MKRLFLYRFYLFYLLLFFFINCEKDTVTVPDELKQESEIIDTSPHSMMIHLDKTEYKKDEIAKITITNILKKDLILGHCAFNIGFDIEKRINRKWEMPYTVTCLAIGEPFYIAQDSTLKRSIHFPIFENELDSVEGFYRLKLWLQDAQERTLIADSLRVSDPFKIVSD